jgi:hypothetical protein
VRVPALGGLRCALRHLGRVSPHPAALTPSFSVGTIRAPSARPLAVARLRSTPGACPLGSLPRVGRAPGHRGASAGSRAPAHLVSVAGSATIPFTPSRLSRPSRIQQGSFAQPLLRRGHLPRRGRFLRFPTSARHLPSSPQRPQRRSRTRRPASRRCVSLLPASNHGAYATPPASTTPMVHSPRAQRQECGESVSHYPARRAASAPHNPEDPCPAQPGTLLRRGGLPGRGKASPFASSAQQSPSPQQRSPDGGSTHTVTASTSRSDRPRATGATGTLRALRGGDGELRRGHHNRRPSAPHNARGNRARTAPRRLSPRGMTANCVSRETSAQAPRHPRTNRTHESGVTHRRSRAPLEWVRR